MQFNRWAFIVLNYEPEPQQCKNVVLTIYPLANVMDLILSVLNLFIIISFRPNYIRAFSFPENYFCEKSSNQPHTKLKDDVLCDYDPFIRPKLDHKNATKISTRMILKSFSYDMYSHCFTINAWTTLVWNDDHLTWKPEEYEGIETTHFSTDSIWTPDLSHYNRYEQDGTHDIINDINCHVSYKGRVVCLTPGKYETLCTADLSNYPYDKQTCTFILGSWVYSGEEVNLEFLNDTINAQELTQNPEWKLLKVTHVRSSGEDECCPNSTFPSLIYVFEFERRGGFEEAITIVPFFGLISMTLLVLFLDASECERITVILCNIIAHILTLQYISWGMPSFGDNVPKIILFGRDSLMIAFFELILTVVLRNLTKSPDQSPSWTMDVVSKALESRVGHMVLVMDFSMKNVAKAKQEDDGENIIDNVQPNTQKDCILFAKLIDRLCFALFLLTYIVMIILFLL